MKTNKLINEMKQITLLRNEFMKDITKIPYFIDGKSSLHKNIWEHLQMIVRIISKLSSEAILPQTTIERLILSTSQYLYYINELNKDARIIDFEIAHYILSLIEKYEEIALDLELYEVCENLKNYKSIYIQL